MFKSKIASMPVGAAQYLKRFGGQNITVGSYATNKLGLDRATCSLKIDRYIIVCAPFLLGFKRSAFIASLSDQELLFFRNYTGRIVGLTLSLNPERRPEPVSFFLRCTLNTVGQMKGRSNTALFVVDYRSSPDEMIVMLGAYLEIEERAKTQYEDYGSKTIRITENSAGRLGYKMRATVSAGNSAPRPVKIINLNTKSVEFMESPGAPVLNPGTPLVFQLDFLKDTVTLNGKVNSAETLPQGIIRTVAGLDFCLELVEIFDGFWYNANMNSLVSTR